MNARKTIFINGRFLTQKITGIQRYCREVLLALDEEISIRPELQDWRWVLLAPSNTVEPKLKTIEVEILPGQRGNLWEQWTLFWKTRKDILLSFGTTGPLLHFNQLITVHDAAVYQVPDAFTWRFKLWYKWMVEWIVRRNRTVFAVSQFSKGEVVRFFHAQPESVCVTTEGWQHLDRIVEASKQEIIDLVGEKPYVLAVSSPTPNKNFRLVVEAMKKLGDVPFQFVVAGGGNAAIFGNSKDDLGNAKFLGYVSDEQLKGLYRHAICFVFPSRYEGFGIPPLEAMSLGCPVLASEIGAVTEVCGDAATYFDPYSSDQLAERLRTMTAMPNSKDVWGPRGLERAKLFSWQEAAHRVANHLIQNRSME